MAKRPTDKKVIELKQASRVSNFCSYYNISLHTISQFLQKHGYWHITYHTVIRDWPTIQRIDHEFSRYKQEKDKYKTVVEKVTFIIPKEIDKEKVRELITGKIPYMDKLPDIKQINVQTNKPSNDSQSEIAAKVRVLHLEDNRFTNIRKTLHLGSQALNSYFTDQEALNICRKMASSFTRSLCDRFFWTKDKKEPILFQIHYIANKALKIYGGTMLTFIHGLRELEFKNKTANEVVTYQKVLPEFPIFSFKMKDDGFNISFFLKQDPKNRDYKADIKVFTSKRDFVASMDTNGYIICKLQKFMPRLQMFYEASKNGTYKFFSGVETGTCEICNKPLTDPNSLRRGVGPVCAANLGIE